MLIDQIFEQRGPIPPSRSCTPIAGYRHDKTIISEEYVRVLLLKYCRRQCTLLFPIWAKSLTKFNT